MHNKLDISIYSTHYTNILEQQSYSGTIEKGMKRKQPRNRWRSHKVFFAKKVKIQKKKTHAQKKFSQENTPYSTASNAIYEIWYKGGFVFHVVSSLNLME